MGASAANCFARNIRRDLTAGRARCRVFCNACVLLSIMRRYPEVEEQYPGRSMCSIPGAQISDSNTADTAVEGTKLIPRLQVDGGSRAQSNKKISLASCGKDIFVVCWSYAFISRCETCHVLLPIKRGLSNMVDLYGRRKSGVTLTVQVDAYSHQKSSCPITSFDDLLGKSVNSAMNGEIFFLKWSQPFMPLLLILRLLKKPGCLARHPGEAVTVVCHRLKMKKWVALPDL